MLSEAEFALIAREVKARSGYALTRELEPNIEARLTPLMRRDSYGSLGELIAAARSDITVWTAIAEALVVPETRFFRDRAFFQQLRSEIAPALIARKGGPLAIWSAGCASGQEAYSLAIMMEELRSEGRGAAEIVATDFSERLLEKARAGLYTQFEVQRGLPIRTLIAHFEKVNELWRIQDRLRANVRFERRNLLEPMTPTGPYDLVLCRYVLSGLAPDARQRALETIAATLAPHGLLALSADTSAADLAGAFTQVAPGVFQRAVAGRQAA